MVTTVIIHATGILFQFHFWDSLGIVKREYVPTPSLSIPFLGFRCSCYCATTIAYSATFQFHFWDSLNRFTRIAKAYEDVLSIPFLGFWR